MSHSPARTLPQRRGASRDNALRAASLEGPIFSSLAPQVATHRDTGMSRGYAFVSYDTVESAEKAISELHNLSVEGRALRVELARSDKAEKPY